MRLHQLRLRAIGPFADEQAIDFERLGVGGLFLLEGPTGVGKSTVLDAVTFALYGSISGSQDDSGRLHSHHADPQVAPEVCLELSLRGQRLRITRVPEHLRPKRRGGGMTRERSSVHLERWQDGRWASRSHAHDEIGTILGELLGLTREQFRQVVLLPQGEFATFLEADDDRRREVLVKLFGTEFFERVTHSLQQRAQETRGALSAAEGELTARVAAAWEAAGQTPEPSPGQPEPSGENHLRALEAVLAEIVGSVAATGAALATARAQEQAVRNVAGEARWVADRARRRAALIDELAEADRQRPEQAQRLARIAGARRALPVRALLELVQAARAEAAATTSRLTAVGVLPDGDAPQEHADRLLASASATERLAAGLAHLLPVEAQLGHDRRDLAAARDIARAGRAESAELRRRGDELPLELDRIAAQIAAARECLTAAEVARRDLVDTRRGLGAARDLAALGGRLEALRQAKRAARRAYDTARDHVDLAVDQRLVGLTGELAGRLVSGDPCLVCGSLEHPAPAGGPGPAMTEERVREAIAVRDEAWLTLESADTALGGAEAQVASLAALAGGRTVAQLEALVAAGEQLSEAGSLAAGQLSRLHEAEAALRAEARDLTSRQLQAGERAAAAEREVAQAESSLATREAEVDAGRGGLPSVAARCASLEDDARRGRAQAAALAEHARAARAVTRAEERAEAEARRAGFEDLAAAHAAAITDEELSTLEQLASRWQSQVDAAEQQLAAEDLRAVADIDPRTAAAIAEAAEAMVASQVRAEQDAQRAVAIAARTQERLSDRLAEVRAAEANRATQAAQHAQVAELDQYARGMAGSPRMTLGTFVLRYWFEQVVAAANVRLQAMSAGKYELLRVDAGRRRDTRVGLGVSVLDRHTGVVRGTGTLSGGESFYTSLSLALGLTDVVTAQAGGAQLDTLFIDEGFGSLDPDTLDDVMAVIDELRGHGRVVGIVSHVPELKERIAERLAIRRVRPDGPSQVEVIA